MSAPDRPANRQPKPRKGRLVLKPSDVDERELDVLRREIADLRAAHNDIVWQVNRQSRWLKSFAEMWHRNIGSAVWRYAMWILPVAIAPYEPHEELNYLQQHDARPDFRPDDAEA